MYNVSKKVDQSNMRVVMFVVPQTLASVMENLPQTNMAELLISLVCLAILVPVKEVNTRYRTRLRTPIPVEILTVRHAIHSLTQFCVHTRGGNHRVLHDM